MVNNYCTIIWLLYGNHYHIGIMAPEWPRIGTTWMASQLVASNSHLSDLVRHPGQPGCKKTRKEWRYDDDMMR